MRSAEQITRTVSELKDRGAAERQRALSEFLSMTRKARESGAEWYLWIVNGRQQYTPEQYAAVKRAEKA